MTNIPSHEGIDDLLIPNEGHGLGPLNTELGILGDLVRVFLYFLFIPGLQAIPFGARVRRVDGSIRLLVLGLVGFGGGSIGVTGRIFATLNDIEHTHGQRINRTGALWGGQWLNGG